VGFLPTDWLILTLGGVDLWRARRWHRVYWVGARLVVAMQYLTTWLFIVHPNGWVRTAALLIGVQDLMLLFGGAGQTRKRQRVRLIVRLQRWRRQILNRESSINCIRIRHLCDTTPTRVCMYLLQGPRQVAAG